jgi:hypothetical protein
MDFAFTEGQLLLQQSLRQYAKDSVGWVMTHPT